jgi:SAM-dependent methyltransferase
MSDDRPRDEWSPFDEGDQEPLAPDSSSAQIIGALALVGREPRRVLELGCGAGRVLVPLAEAGHDVTGIDRDGAQLTVCRRRLGGRQARLVAGDFARPWPDDLGAFDFVCCLGNTFMMVWDVDAAVALLRRVEASLAPRGAFVIDDIPGQLWPELTCGNWLSGTDEDGLLQMVWAEDDAVFELRRGDDVDEDDWTIGPPERRMRLWTMGALRLAGSAAGLSAIQRRGGSALLVMRRGSS